MSDEGQAVVGVPNFSMANESYELTLSRSSWPA